MALPALPQLRVIDGPVGTFLREIRSFLQSIKNLKLLSGKEVSITFSAADIAGSIVKRTLTGLGYPPTGFFIYRGHVGASLIESAAPTSEIDTSVLYLRATVAATYLIWVF
jgi:hypothetical protein